MRIYLEIHMQFAGLAIGAYKPNLHGWSFDWDFLDYYSIEDLPENLKNKFNLDENGFFGESTLQEVIDKYNITPIQSMHESYVHGFIENADVETATAKSFQETGFTEVYRMIEDDGYTSCFRKFVNGRYVFVIGRFNEDGELFGAFGIVDNEVKPGP